MPTLSRTFSETDIRDSISEQVVCELWEVRNLWNSKRTLSVSRANENKTLKHLTATERAIVRVPLKYKE